MVYPDPGLAYNGSPPCNYILSCWTATHHLPFHLFGPQQSLSVPPTTHTFFPPLIHCALPYLPMIAGIPIYLHGRTFQQVCQAWSISSAQLPTTTRPLIHDWVFLLGMITSSLVPIAQTMLTPLLFEWACSRLHCFPHRPHPAPIFMLSVYHCVAGTPAVAPWATPMVLPNSSLNLHAARLPCEIPPLTGVSAGDSHPHFMQLCKLITT